MKITFKGKKQFFKWRRWIREELGMRRVDKNLQRRSLRYYRERATREVISLW
jgi:hypothetical protein